MDEQLFLSDKIDAFRAAVRDDNNAKPWVAMANELAKLGLALLNEVEVPTYDGQKFAAAGIFVRAHQSVQAAVILLERGLIIDARSVLRTVVESAIALNALANDPDFGKRLAEAGHYNSLKLITMLLDRPNTRARLTPEDISRIELARAELLAIPKEKRQPINWADASTENCPDLYDTLYRLFSMDGVHITVGSLSRQFEMDDTGEITLMKVGPDAEGLVTTLHLACAAYIHSIEPFVRMYPLSGYAEKVEEITARFKTMDVSEIVW